MIRKHNSIVRSEAIINSFISSAQSCDNIDGIVEVFKSEDQQGFMMKLYQNYSPDSDLCIWVYEDFPLKTIYTVIGKHNNCTNLNTFEGEDLIVNQYPIKVNIKATIVSNLINDVYAYYDKNIKI